MKCGPNPFPTGPLPHFQSAREAYREGFLINYDAQDTWLPDQAEASLARFRALEHALAETATRRRDAFVKYQIGRVFNWAREVRHGLGAGCSWVGEQLRPQDITGENPMDADTGPFRGALDCGDGDIIIDVLFSGSSAFPPSGESSTPWIVTGGV
ncbi:uncharacterized protein EI90DRAFT_3076073, partial [Cantharellus anzutake]|uniref:uncharacterized protein n=1 Tax=Cantharellus anzutake TaxID=1750568 RepID=UPI001906D4C3